MKTNQLQELSPRQQQAMLDLESGVETNVDTEVWEQLFDLGLVDWDGDRDYITPQGLVVMAEYHRPVPSNITSYPMYRTRTGGHVWVAGEDNSRARDWAGSEPLLVVFRSGEFEPSLINRRQLVGYGTDDTTVFFGYDADCPFCLRHIWHSGTEHEEALARNYDASQP